MPPANNVGIGYETLDQANQPASIVPSTHSGNWLTHLLPTGGALAGGAGGAAIGTMILPGIGTVAGGILGAALGSGESKALENGIEHQDLGNGVASAAIEGGAGQAVGGVVGKVLGKGAEYLANRASGITKAADEAAQMAAMDKAAADAATNLKNAYADVPKGLRQQYDASGQTDFVKNLGLDPTNPQNLVDTAGHANGVLDPLLNDALGKSGTRDISDYNDIVKQALANNGFDLGSFDKVALARGRLGYSNTPAAQLLQQLEQHGMGVANSNADPTAVRSLIGRLQSMAADAKPGVSATTGAVDPVQKAQYKTINEVVSNLKDRLYNNDALKANISELKPNIQAADVGGNQALADHLNTTIGNAQEGQDVLNELSRFTNMNKLGKSALVSQQDVASPAALARAKGDLNGDGIPDNTQQPPSTVEVGHKILSGGGGTAGVVGRAIMHGKDNPNILNVMSRIGRLGSKLAPAAATVAATSPNLAAAAVPINDTMGTMNSMPSAPMTNTASQGNDLQNYINALEAQSVLAPGLNPGSTSVMGSLVPTLQHNQILNSEINGLPASYANAGGAQGTGGLLTKIWGNINPASAAGQYSAQQIAIAKALGIDPAILPQVMQNQDTAGVSQNILGQMQSQLVY